jgi:tRNA A-37 threonylcarbamoyl transferase component Bud32
MLLTPGSVFAGDYHVDRPLAEGGMGAVYVATQISTGQPRALKVMQPQLVSDEKSRARFLEEARIGSRIASEHVVSVVAAGVDPTSGMPWLAMELLEGVDLDRYVRERGALSPAETLELLEQAAHALADAHRKGIIHRDLKPENVFVARARRRNAESTVKILDFGIARTIAESRVAATVTTAIGSPLWMAPEQAQSGAKLTPSTDVWALGLIAFYMVSGRQYWLAANHPDFNLSALLVEVMTQGIVPPSQRAAELGSSVPNGFDGWFLRCVARDPSHRFADAGAAIDALRTALTHSLVSTTRPSRPEAQPLRSGRPTAPVTPPTAVIEAPRSGPAWGVIAMGTVAAVLLLGLASLGIWWLAQEDETSDPRARVAAAPAIAAPPETDQPPAPPPAVVPLAQRANDAPAAVEHLGRLPEAEITRVATSHLSDYLRCYRGWTQAHPGEDLQIVVTFVIGVDGHVQSADASESQPDDLEAEACVSEAVVRWLFPCPEGGSVRARHTASIEGEPAPRRRRVVSPPSGGSYGSSNQVPRGYRDDDGW